MCWICCYEALDAFLCTLDVFLYALDTLCYVFDVFLYAYTRWTYFFQKGKNPTKTCTKLSLALLWYTHGIFQYIQVISTLKGVGFNLTSEKANIVKPSTQTYDEV